MSDPVKNSNPKNDSTKTEQIEKFYGNFLLAVGIKLTNWPFSKRYYTYKFLQTEYWEELEKCSQNPSPQKIDIKEYEENWKKVWEFMQNSPTH